MEKAMRESGSTTHGPDRKQGISTSDVLPDDWERDLENETIKRESLRNESHCEKKGVDVEDMVMWSEEVTR